MCIKNLNIKVQITLTKKKDICNVMQQIYYYYQYRKTHTGWIRSNYLSYFIQMFWKRWFMNSDFWIAEKIRSISAIFLLCMYISEGTSCIFCIMYYLYKISYHQPVSDPVDRYTPHPLGLGDNQIHSSDCYTACGLKQKVWYRVFRIKKKYLISKLISWPSNIIGI